MLVVVYELQNVEIAASCYIRQGFSVTEVSTVSA